MLLVVFVTNWVFTGKTERPVFGEMLVSSTKNSFPGVRFPRVKMPKALQDNMNYTADFV